MAKEQLSVKNMDKDLLENMINKYSDNVLRIAFTYIKDKSKAEDICQELFIKLFKLNPVFENDEHEKAWIIRSTINLSINFLNMFWNRKTIPFDQGKFNIKVFDNDIIDIEHKRDVLDAVMSLALKNREVIMLFYYEGYKIEEISNLIGVPAATVKTRLLRGRKKLEKILKGGEFGDD